VGHTARLFQSWAPHCQPVQADLASSLATRAALLVEDALAWEAEEVAAGAEEGTEAAQGVAAEAAQGTTTADGTRTAGDQQPRSRGRKRHPLLQELGHASDDSEGLRGRVAAAWRRPLSSALPARVLLPAVSARATLARRQSDL
jgi:hypothetical protein